MTETQQAWIERTATHAYSMNLIWDGTNEMLEALKADGYRPIKPESKHFIADFQLNNEHKELEFGMALAECYSRMCDNNYFVRALYSSSYEEDKAETRYETSYLEPWERCLGAIRQIGLDSFIYILTGNHDERFLAEAKEKMSVLDGEGFYEWLQANVPLRTDGPSSPAECDQFALQNYRIGDTRPTVSLLRVYNDYWYSSEKVDAYKSWVEEHKNTSLIRGLFSTYGAEDGNAFLIKYLFCEGKVCEILFKLLNDPNADINTKRTILTTFSDYGQKDPQFISTIQENYEQYRDFSGGKPITFRGTPVSTFDTNQDNYELPEKEYYNSATKASLSPEQVGKLCDELIKNGLLKEEGYTRDLLYLRLLGDPKQKGLTGMKIKWYGSLPQLCAFIKVVADDTKKFIKAESFFVLINKSGGGEVEFDPYDASSKARSAHIMIGKEKINFGDWIIRLLS